LIFRGGDSLEKAMSNAVKAIELTVKTMIEDGQPIPDDKGWVWAVVDAPVEKYFGPAEKINITVPQAILARIDSYAKVHGLSRSGFLVDAARAMMQR
jgi:hypothetical protein